MARGWMARHITGTLLAALALSLGGCELLYLMGGSSTHPASFKFPKGHRVLVLVELNQGVAAPPAFATTLADAVGSHLLQNKAVDAPLIRQDQLISLQQANPEAYANMHLGDVATTLNADNVLYIKITQLQTNVTADGTVADGAAEAFVKVLDKQGTRLWPGDVTGQRLLAQVTTGLLSDRDIPNILKSLNSQLADQTDALFHETAADARHISH